MVIDKTLHNGTINQKRLCIFNIVIQCRLILACHFICSFFFRMIPFNQAADQTSEAAKALVCPLQRDVEQLKRDVGDIWEILKKRKPHGLREVNEIRQPSQKYTGAFIYHITIHA